MEKSAGHSILLYRGRRFDRYIDTEDKINIDSRGMSVKKKFKNPKQIRRKEKWQQT